MDSTDVDRFGTLRVDDHVRPRSADPSELVETPTALQQGVDDGIAPVEAAERHPRSSRPSDRVRARNLRNSRIALGVVVLLSALLVGLHIHGYRPLSPFDEPQHIDYVYRVLQGQVPASGDFWSEPTTKAYACRSVDYPLSQYPTCGGPATRNLLPNGGLTTAFIHTPAYYTVAAAAVWASAHLLPTHIDEISVMRATGILWLAVALALMWLLWRDLGVSWKVRSGLSLALVAAPAVLLAQGTVTNDATAIAAGAAVTLAAWRWDAGRVRLWVPLVLAVLAVVLKSTNMSALILACVFVLVRSVQRRAPVTDRWWKGLSRRSLVFTGSLALVALAVSLGWTLIQGARATLDQRLIPQNVALTHNHFQFSWLSDSVLSMVTPLQEQFLQTVLNGQIGAVVESLANAGLLVLAIVGAVRSRPGSAARALAVATGVALLVFGPLLDVMFYVSLHNHFGLPARYGFALLPAMLVISGTAVRSRLGQFAVLAVGACMYGAIVFQLLR